MITKERLEELIKEKATIYILVKKQFIAGTSSFIEIVELPLKNYHGISVEKYNKINNCKPHLYQGGEFMPYEKVAELEDLFETEEDARWELEMTATRTETLKMPTWEEFNNQDKLITFRTYSHNCHFFKYGKYIVIRAFYGQGGMDIFSKTLSKENYIEACKLCLKLFKGEEV